ncbi:peptidoglycan/LPS O-acetylase OafA/YrhL [Paenibacillus endophyticus]|uniref:Peptidoglycan/LPS O-acetylase OafA/YrhL n=1 Tax=Paenibacillus endophyticus TaxID=1294268 RepID=A0A7W5GBF3_9BACL|nr:acyltransferase [Paenibacillus endophyticus]MBB3153308.1 peptidoglycan/LPS O-acetylase OafA/YrhL [Paenibacillus endophyticus]
MQRYEQLDSLRGLAALAVMIGHFLMVFTPIVQNTSGLGLLDYPLNLLKYTPLHAIWGGHEAVIMFFLLSGFVLSLPFFSNRQQTYTKYVIKRICRIYIPFVIALLIAIAMREAVYVSKLTDLTSYYNNLWVIPPNWSSFIHHLLFVGNYNTTRYDPILWTLVHEMRISLLFPFIMFAIVKGGWKLGLPLALLLSYGAEILLANFETRYMTNFVVTLHYASFFIVGALLAKYQGELKMLFLRLNGCWMSLLLVIGLCCYSFKWIGYGEDFHDMFMPHGGDWMTAIGASIFIVAAISSVRLSRQLQRRPLLFLGKISYSLYLYHMIVLLSLVHLLEGKLDTPIIVVIAFVVSFGAGAMSYYLVELPSIRLGKRLTNWGKKPAAGTVSHVEGTAASM